MDGFTLVVGRKGRRGRKGKSSVVAGEREEEEEVTPQQIASLRASIRTWEQRLSRTELFAKLPGMLPEGITGMVCFGLGRLSTYRSLVQLALLLLLRTTLGREMEVVYFDPSHSLLDHVVMGELGLVRLEQGNDEGRFTLDSPKVLYFMPHCDRWLYSNLLEHNRLGLERVVVLGNSLRGYCDRDDRTRDALPELLPRMQETMFVLREDGEVMDNTILFESFNDIGITTFTFNSEAISDC
ncbi:hypothetical protein BASA81_002413 [Batrachochytrium salamandrivorans]|nr:hypothetical protein BASA81_002413 [Batrachochytrium salamandrivorans]